MRTVLTVGLLLGVVEVAAAQSSAKAPTNESMYISTEQLQGIMDRIPASKDTGKPGAFSSRIFSASTYSMSFIRLNEPDTPHAHGAWSEVFIVRAGAGVLETGGTITGVNSHNSATHQSLFVNAEGKALPPQPQPAASAAPRRETPGDLAGTGIDGGHKQAVKAGDVILVPAGVAHHWVQVDQPVVYLDIKFPKAE
jgi:mannose-6-phosphate isomerase-like protein (cupin superfamily)